MTVEKKFEKKKQDHIQFSLHISKYNEKDMYQNLNTHMHIYTNDNPNTCKQLFQCATNHSDRSRR